MGGQKKEHLPTIIAFQRDNDLKLKFIRGKKAYIYMYMKKTYFGRHPVMQAVEAKRLGPFYKILIF